jgi:hypothetical protein
VAGVLIDVDATRLTFFATESAGDVAVNRAIFAGWSTTAWRTVVILRRPLRWQ